jgi:predicted  nucleic acid-binding Zn-ribbon protein
MELMERVEKAEGQSAKIDAALLQLAKQEERLTEEFKSKGGELQSELEALRVHRDAVATAIAVELLERYETAREAKGGVGAGKLAGSTCTACRIELPAEKVAGLLAQGGVGVCPACHRLLVILDEVDA